MRLAVNKYLSKILFNILSFLLFQHWNHDYGARCKCENSANPRCVLLEHAQFSSEMLRNFSVFALGVSLHDWQLRSSCNFMQMDLLPFAGMGQTRGSWSKKARSSDTLRVSLVWPLFNPLGFHSYLPHLGSQAKLVASSKCQNLFHRCDSTVKRRTKTKDSFPR